MRVEERPVLGRWPFHERVQQLAAVDASWHVRDVLISRHWLQHGDAHQGLQEVLECELRHPTIRLGVNFVLNHHATEDEAPAKRVRAGARG